MKESTTSAPTRPLELRELRREVDGMRRANQRRSGVAPPLEFRSAGPERLRPRRPAPYGRRRLALLLSVGAMLAILTLVLTSGSSRSAHALPSRADLAGLGVRERILTIARSQVGYVTDPAGSYCNKFSGYWGEGDPGCPAGERSEKWCADFAAWVWAHAGVRFAYGFDSGDINAGAVSFYEWAIDTGHWHPAGSGFRAEPGDVAVYGLSLAGVPTAAHVAIVVSDPRGQAGPDVINGDGDRTGFSVVETAEDQVQVHVDTGRRHSARLAGYVSP